MEDRVSVPKEKLEQVAYEVSGPMQPLITRVQNAEAAEGATVDPPPEVMVRYRLRSCHF